MTNDQPVEESSPLGAARHLPLTSLKEKRRKASPWKIECHPKLARLAQYSPSPDHTRKPPYCGALSPEHLLYLMHLRPYVDVVVRDSTLMAINNWKAVLLARMLDVREIAITIVSYSDEDLPALIYLDIMTHIQSVPDGKVSLYKKQINELFMTMDSNLLRGSTTEKFRTFLPKASAHRLTDRLPGSQRGPKKS